MFILPLLALLPFCQALIRTYGVVESNNSAITHNLHLLTNRLSFVGATGPGTLVTPSLSIEILPRDQEYTLQIVRSNNVIMTGCLLSHKEINRCYHRENSREFALLPNPYHSLQVAAAFPKLNVSIDEHKQLVDQFNELYDSDHFYYYQKKLIDRWADKYDFVCFTICLKGSSVSEHPSSFSRVYSSADAYRFLNESKMIEEVRNDLLRQKQEKEILQQRFEALIASVKKENERRAREEKIAIFEEEAAKHGPDSPYHSGYDTWSEDENMID